MSRADEPDAPRGGRSPKLPSRRRLVRRGRELGREARALIKRKGRRAGSGAVDAVRPHLEAVEAQLPRGTRRRVDERALLEALEALDQALEEHFGRFRKGLLREYVEAIAWAVVLALVIRSFFFEAFSIPSGSMLPTLEIGDRLFVNKIGLGLYVPFSSHRLLQWDQPDRGDIVVFEFHCDDSPNNGEDYIKRVVGLPGDRIRLKDNVLHLDGEPIPTESLGEQSCPVYGHGREDEVDRSGTCRCIRQRETLGGNTYVTQHMKPGQGGPFASRCRNRPDWPRKSGVDRRPCQYFGEAASNPEWPQVEIPEGHVLVMGDNRDRSEDGRYWGFVPLNRIKGVAFVVWWARDTSRLFKWLE